MDKRFYGWIGPWPLIGIIFNLGAMAYAVSARAHCGEHAGACNEFVVVDESDGYCEESSNPREFGTWWQNGEVESHWCVTTDPVVINGETVKEAAFRFAGTCDPDNPLGKDADCWRVAGAVGGICNPITKQCLCQTATCTVCYQDLAVGDTRRTQFQAGENACIAGPSGSEYRPFEHDSRCLPRVPCEGPREGGKWMSHGIYKIGRASCRERV